MRPNSKKTGLFSKQDFLDSISSSISMSEAKGRCFALRKNSVRNILFYNFLSEIKPDISHFTVKKRKLDNQEFGDLIAQEELKERTRHGSRQYKCLCKCGNTINACVTVLVNGQIKDCGCKRLNDDKLALINRVYTSYSHPSKKKKMNISKDIFGKLIFENCYYCGSPPLNKLARWDLRYNGIDRIDSSRGYFIDNIVPCCKICNFAKLDMTKTEFLEWLVNTAKYQVSLVGYQLPEYTI